MRAISKILTVGLVLAGAMQVSHTEAAAPGRVLAREPMPVKGETCKPRWPYVVLTCVA